MNSKSAVNPLFAPLPVETRRLLDRIPALIDKTFPLPGRFRPGLPKDVAELSRLLTSGRGERGLSYLGRPSLLSAYLRFFLPWNLYRLCRLLPGLNLTFAANDRITDLGCGPLTFAAALWICRPDLRPLPLEFYCVDRSGPALDAGKKFFAALAGENSPWRIHTVKGDLYTVKAQPAALVCAINVFNEMYGDISRGGTDKLRRSAEKSARLLVHHASAQGTAQEGAVRSAAILTVEPGFPRCGEFISLLRGVFLKQGYNPLSPCPHDIECPLADNGKSGAHIKKRWCHFAFATEDAPPALHKLSSAARLPKERAVLSFLFARPADTKQKKTKVAAANAMSNAEESAASAALRIISDAFPLPPHQFGRYGCSEQGLVLLAGHKSAIEKTASGALVYAALKNGERDSKSGALLAEIANTL
jgi:ribosomal protein RSM22 (predicted rRNA methylase)